MLVCRGVMKRGLRSFVRAFLLGGMAVAAVAAEPAAVQAPLSSDLEQLTLRQAEIFFAARNRELQFGRRLVEGAEADRLTASARPNPNVFANTGKFNSRKRAARLTAGGSPARPA